MSLHAIAAPKILWRIANCADDLPNFPAFLAFSHPKLPLSPDDRQIILFARVQTGELMAFAVANDDASPVVHATLVRARHAGFQVVAHYQLDEQLFDAVLAQAETGRATRVEALDNDTDRLINSILERAVRLRATDVHFDAGPTSAEVRVRVDGRQQAEPIAQLSVKQQGEIARALYGASEDIQSQDWTEDLYFDASVSRRVTGQEYRLRFSQRNSFYGFDFSLRLLPVGSDNFVTDFSQLGFVPWQINTIEESLRDPHGMVLLVGAMNSGKSTTLAASLAHMVENFPHRRIQTMENPIEYRIRGVRQSSISERASRGKGEEIYQAALRALMRSDANVLMLGEVRDRLSAQCAQTLRDTGHKFFSTIHAATPVLALQRFAGYGAEPAVLFSEGFIKLVMQQQLLPRVCPQCAMSFKQALAQQRLPARLVEGLRQAAGAHVDALQQVRVKGGGCEQCRGTGFNGRSVTAALLCPDAAFNAAMLHKDYDKAAALWQRGEAATPHEAPYNSLLGHGIEKIFAGEVCPLVVDEELATITPASVVATRRQVAVEKLAA